MTKMSRDAVKNVNAQLELKLARGIDAIPRGC